MPTVHKRTYITHTPRVQHLLDVASARWPEASPLTLMVNLMATGAEAVEQSLPDAAIKARTTALERLANEIDADYGHLYTENYLDEVRSGWE